MLVNESDLFDSGRGAFVFAPAPVPAAFMPNWLPAAGLPYRQMIFGLAISH